jgi:ABC-type polysaccharide/polyol phosphate export permease
MAHLLTDVTEMITEQFQFRELLYQMTKRDLLLRYKQTAMGVGWAVFMPLVNTIVFSVIFMRVAPINTGVPYPLFAFCGLFTWNLFASSLRFAVNSLTTNPNLVTKVFFPREIFPFAATLVSLVDFVVSSVVLAGGMAYYHIVPGAMVLFLPAVLAAHLAFTLAMALLLSMANLFYRDVKYLFEIVLTVWMFVTAVLYPSSLVGGKLGLVMRLNPMTPIVEAYRAVLLYGRSPFTPDFLAATALSFAMLGVSWVLFHRAEYQFAENI